MMQNAKLVHELKVQFNEIILIDVLVEVFYFSKSTNADVKYNSQKIWKEIFFFLNKNTLKLLLVKDP